jgi:hypothetical protein
MTDRLSRAAEHINPYKGRGRRRDVRAKNYNLHKKGILPLDFDVVEIDENGALWIGYHDEGYGVPPFAQEPIRVENGTIQWHRTASALNDQQIFDLLAATAVADRYDILDSLSILKTAFLSLLWFLIGYSFARLTSQIWIEYAIIGIGVVEFATIVFIVINSGKLQVLKREILDRLRGE